MFSCPGNEHVGTFTQFLLSLQCKLETCSAIGITIKRTMEIVTSIVRFKGTSSLAAAAAVAESVKHKLQHSPVALVLAIYSSHHLTIVAIGDRPPSQQPHWFVPLQQSWQMSLQRRDSHDSIGDCDADDYDWGKLGSRKNSKVVRACLTIKIDENCIIIFMFNSPEASLPTRKHLMATNGKDSCCCCCCTHPQWDHVLR